MGLLLNNREKTLFDRRNVEVLRLAGADSVILWSKAVNPYAVPGLLFGTSASGIDGLDCLYGEPNQVVADAVKGTQHGYYKSYQVLGLYEEPSVAFDLSIFGGDEVMDSVMWFSRSDLETRKIPRDPQNNHVKSGDIVELSSKDKLESFFIEIVNANRTGWINDSLTWTQYKCECVRANSIPPENKIP